LSKTTFLILDRPREIGDTRRMRVMGLDIGSQTIGVAISDELGVTAQALKTIRRRSKQEDLQELSSLISKFDIGKIVVGLPLNMDGSQGKQAERVLTWAGELHQALQIPVLTWDERLSTVSASKILLEADLSRKKRKKVIDQVAAVIILQGYLDQTGRFHHDPYRTE